MEEKDELRTFRAEMGMTQAALGEWLATRIGARRAYTTSEVSNWETGARSVPSRVTVAILRHQLAACRQSRRTAFAGESAPDSGTPTANVHGNVR